MRTVSKKQYDQMVKEVSPPSPVFKDCLLAFVTGGFICTIGQWLCNAYQGMGLEVKDARAVVSISLILISAALTAFGWYDNLAKHAGAGMLVPITGFANSMVSPAMEFKAETITNGTCTKMFTIAGPVLVFGVCASVVYGLVLWILQMWF